MAEDQPLTLHARVTAAIGRAAVPRMWGWLYLSIALVAFLWWIAADQFLKLLLWKGALLTIGAFAGDKVARFMEGSNSRPHELLDVANAIGEDNVEHHARRRELELRADSIYLRRAIIIVGAMLLMGLGT